MIDLVHKKTRAYRSLLNAFAFPGSLRSIEGFDLDSGLSSAANLIALVLLDSEVTFCAQQANPSALIPLTYSKIASPEIAGYIFISPSAGMGVSEFLNSAIKTAQKAKRGSLESPEKSATIILDLQTLGASFILDNPENNPEDNPASAKTIKIIGPGIEFPKPLKLKLTSEFIKELSDINKDFPTGLDFIFVFEDQILGIPRTTRFMEAD